MTTTDDADLSGDQRKTAEDISVPTLSIIIPVRNNPGMLDRCVQAIEFSSLSDFELIIVDDASDSELDDSVKHRHGRLIRLEQQSGPAFARNVGSTHATGDILVFLDADVCVATDTLQKIADRFAIDPDLDALFGSYDDAPAADNFVSQYRNLLHHYVHQTSNKRASSFWSGCGAIRRSVFLQSGGFNEAYAKPSIEDIELGLRMLKAGNRIELDPSIQVKHLKRWTFWNMLRCDIFSRGVPWTRLIHASGEIPNDLNLRYSQRISCALTFGLLLVLMIGAWTWSGVALMFGGAVAALFAIDYWTDSKRIPDIIRWLGISIALAMGFWFCSKLTLAFFIAVAMAVAIVLLNAGFYAFLARVRYPLFAIAVLPLHLLFFLCCGVAFVLGTVLHLFAGRNGRHGHEMLSRKPNRGNWSFPD